MQRRSAIASDEHQRMKMAGAPENNPYFLGITGGSMCKQSEKEEQQNRN